MTLYANQYAQFSLNAAHMHVFPVNFRPTHLPDHLRLPVSAGLPYPVYNHGARHHDVVSQPGANMSIHTE
ncbi:hypothetical protein DPMN_146592 [Dreissena polymorpha]|uniref:Uncharacterized protein n=1 Tax=Dreissena polymorpha TaxID=45954 RepID=A0A9D4J2H6_DREPO|nr:hypothetical protein DPMN_146592 [Dreissena polymorpha]